MSPFAHVSITLPLDFVAVDYLAKAIVDIATTRAATRRAYHLTNPSPEPADMFDRMRAAGDEIHKVPNSSCVSELAFIYGCESEG